MFQFKGEAREKIGWHINKAILVQYMGERTLINPECNPDGKDNDLTEPRSVKMYRYIAQHYFMADERFWNYRKTRTYELHPENSNYFRNECYIQYIDFETGNPVGMLDTTQVVYPPNVLSRLLKVEHVEAAARASLGGNTNLLMCLLSFGIGAVLFLMIGMNMPAITSAIQGAPMASPTPPLAMIRP